MLKRFVSWLHKQLNASEAVVGGLNLVLVGCGGYWDLVRREELFLLSRLGSMMLAETSLTWNGGATCRRSLSTFTNATSYSIVSIYHNFLSHCYVGGLLPYIGYCTYYYNECGHVHILFN